MTTTLLKFRIPWLFRTSAIELSGVAVGIAAVGIAAFYFFYRRRKPKGHSFFLLIAKKKIFILPVWVCFCLFMLQKCRLKTRCQNTLKFYKNFKTCFIFPCRCDHINLEILQKI